MRNVQDLNSNISKSFVFQAYGKPYMSAWDYYTYVVLFTLIVSSIFMMLYYVALNKRGKQGGSHVR